MITINVDEAYALDYYSILELKYKMNFISKDILDITKKDLLSQIGENRLKEIFSSKEYKELQESNKITFEAVDQAKTDECLASYVDKCNYKRMLAKKSIQEKFFKLNLTEAKIGYEKHD